MNKLLAKSLTYYNYENARKKAIQEEEIYESYNPPIPKYVKPKVQPLTAGIWNLVRQMLP